MGSGASRASQLLKIYRACRKAEDISESAETLTESIRFHIKFTGKVLDAEEIYLRFKQKETKPMDIAKAGFLSEDAARCYDAATSERRSGRRRRLRRRGRS